MQKCCKELVQALQAEGKESCFEKRTVAEENDKKFKLLNRSKKSICRVKVDDCLIKDQNTKKCDFLFKVCEDEQYLLVELKGSDVQKAIAQIIATFEHINAKLNLPPANFKGYVVSSSVPRGAEQRFNRLKEKCLKDKKLKIHKTTDQHNISV